MGRESPGNCKEVYRLMSVEPNAASHKFMELELAKEERQVLIDYRAEVENEVAEMVDQIAKKRNDVIRLIYLLEQKEKVIKQLEKELSAK